MPESTAILLNPAGTRGRDGRRWIAVQRQCLRELAPAEVTPVQDAAEAARVAKDAALGGIRRIVAVGETATVHGVVNGLMELAESHRRTLKVGFLSLTRPGPWSRTLELPRGLSRQLEVLAAGHTLPYDVGRVECRTVGGQPVTRYFLNSASFGMAGQWRQALREGRGNGARGRNGSAADAGHTARVRLETDEGVLFEGACGLGMLMGGQYDPALGHVAPQADPTDGRLELAWLRGGPWWEVALRLATVWLGALRSSESTLAWHSVHRLRAVPLDDPLYLTLDGQPAGVLPATFSVAARTLPVIVAPVAVDLRKPAFKPMEKLGNGRLVGNIKSAAGL